MVRTEHDALELVRQHLVVTEVPATGVRSLVEAVAGGPVSGSWREHAKGRLMYRLGRQLRASEEVLAVRLVEGKVAFVDRPLWAAVYRVAMEPSRRRRSLEGLSPQARALLSQVEREREVRLPRHSPWDKAEQALEERLLVHVSETQAEEGHHVVVLRSWRHWASPVLQEAAGHAHLRAGPGAAGLRMRRRSSRARAVGAVRKEARPTLGPRPPLLTPPDFNSYRGPPPPPSSLQLGLPPVPAGQPVPTQYAAVLGCCGQVGSGSTCTVHFPGDSLPAASATT
jgi:hypothetical protein